MILYYLSGEQQRRWSDCVDAQADLRLLLFAYAIRHVFSWPGSIYMSQKCAKWQIIYQNTDNQPFYRSTNLSNYVFEPPHDKTNIVTMRPAKTQISLGVRPVWSESSLCAQWVAKDQSFFMRTETTLIRLCGRPGWSESSQGAQSLCWFCHEAAHLWMSFN